MIEHRVLFSFIAWKYLMAGWMMSSQMHCTFIVLVTFRHFSHDKLLYRLEERFGVSMYVSRCNVWSATSDVIEEQNIKLHLTTI